MPLQLGGGNPASPPRTVHGRLFIYARLPWHPLSRLSRERQPCLLSALPHLASNLGGCLVRAHPLSRAATSGGLPPATVGQCHPFSGPCRFSVFRYPVLWPPMQLPPGVTSSAVTSLRCPPTLSAPHAHTGPMCCIPCLPITESTLKPSAA